MHPFHDKGYVFIGSYGAYDGAYLLDVLDGSSMSEEKAFDLDGCWGCNYATSHLIERDGRLIYMIRSYPPPYEELPDCGCPDLGVDVRTGEPIAELGANDLKYAYVGGAPGAIISDGDFSAPIHADGRKAVVRSKGGLEAHDLDWALPPGLPMEGHPVRLVVNNDHMRVLAELARSRFYPPGVLATGVFHVFAKTTGQWSVLQLPGSSFPMEEFRFRMRGLDTSGMYFVLRPYRDWLIGEELQAPDALNLDPLEKQQFPPFWSAAERIREKQAAPTGRFRLYNARTQELILHDTGEPNSEVLYVDENDALYYRVSDELRLAQIKDGELARPEVLVKSPVLWAVHWLFFGTE